MRIKCTPILKRVQCFGLQLSTDVTEDDHYHVNQPPYTLCSSRHRRANSNALARLGLLLKASSTLSDRNNRRLRIRLCTDLNND